MTDPKDKEQIEAVIKASFLLSVIDLTLATICAIYGDSLFVPFMLLAGVMYAYGKWLKSRMDETGE